MGQTYRPKKYSSSRNPYSRRPARRRRRRRYGLFGIPFSTLFFALFLLIYTQKRMWSVQYV